MKGFQHKLTETRLLLTGPRPNVRGVWQVIRAAFCLGTIARIPARSAKVRRIPRIGVKRETGALALQAIPVLPPQR